MSEKQIWIRLSRLILLVVLVLAFYMLPPVKYLDWIPFSPHQEVYAATENFSTWSETDNSSDITVTAATVTVDTMASNVESHVNKSVSISGNFSIDFELNVGSLGTNSRVGWFMLSEGADTINEAKDADSGLLVFSSSSSEYLYLYDYATDDYDRLISADSYYYITLTRIGTTANCYLYSDEDREDLVDNFEITCATTTYDTAVVAYSYEADNTDTGSGIIYNLDLHEGEPFVSNLSVTGIGASSATLNANIVIIRDTEITDIGFEWGTSSGVYTSNWTDSGTWGLGSFSHEITGLSSGAVYWRAMARNNFGNWGYSVERDFNTFSPTNSIVDNTTSHYSVRMPHEERVYYTQGLWWVFYGAEDGNDETDPKIKYKTSSDNGTTWSSSTTIRNGNWDVTYGNHGSAGFGVTLDNNGDFHYSYAQGSFVYYRKGTPDSNGDIIWADSEQTVMSSSAWHSAITSNTTGHPWMIFIYGTSVNATSSSTNDGTWTDTGGQNLGSSQSFMMIPLTEDRFYAIEGLTNTSGFLYDGSSWGAEETIATVSSGGFPCQFGIVGDDEDNVYMVTHNSTQLIFLKRTYGVGWGEPDLIADNVTTHTSPVMTLLDNGQFLIVWAGGEDAGEDHILYYRVGELGDWGDITVLQDESANELSRHDNLAISRFEEDAGVGLIYGVHHLDGWVTPYKVLFMHIDPTTLEGYEEGGVSIPTVTTVSWGDNLAGIAICLLVIFGIGAYLIKPMGENAK